MVSKSGRKSALHRRRNKPPAQHEAVTGSDARRERFVAEYLLDNNATQAAIRAGYSPRSAGTTGHRLLRDAEISAEISARRQVAIQKAEDRYAVTADRIQRELAILGMSNAFDYGQVEDDGSFRVDFRNTTREAAGALQSVKTKRSVRYVGDAEIHETTTEFRLASKREALVDLGKIHGLFRDGVDVTVPVTFTVVRTRRGEEQAA